MSIFDIVVIILLVPAIFSGYTKGFISQIFSIIAIVVSIWSSVHFADQLCDYLKDTLMQDNPVLLKIIAFVIILVLVSLVLVIIGKIIEKFLKIIMLGWLNKLLGIIFSLIKWALILSLLIGVFNNINHTMNLFSAEQLNECIFYKPLNTIYTTVFPYLQQLIFNK